MQSLGPGITEVALMVGDVGASRYAYSPEQNVLVLAAGQTPQEMGQAFARWLERMNP